jgi:Zn-dependent alcohol dehydrogenase
VDPVPTSILGCAVITGAGGVLRSVKVKPGQSVAIFGVGGVGLCAVAAASALDAYPIIAVDLDDEKLALARSFGATHEVNARGSDPVAAIRQLTADPVLTDATGQPVAGVDYAFDCVGAPATMVQIFGAARSMALGKTSGGTAVLIGVPLTPLTLDPMDFHMNEKKYRGSLAGTCRPDRDIPVFLEWYRSGQLPLDRLVTRRYRLDEVAEAVEALDSAQVLGRSVFVFDGA